VVRTRGGMEETGRFDVLVSDVFVVRNASASWSCCGASGSLFSLFAANLVPVDFSLVAVTNW
jgi:hypothetical protein